MKNYTFNWEVQTLIEQFVQAFNDVIVKRYDNNETVVAPTSGDKVMFVYSPKQRVFSNLNSPAAGGLTVPVIAVNLSSIARDQSRVVNKIEGFKVDYNPKDGSGEYILPVLQPVPVNIGVDMTIITRYQSDMDQILTNFIPYCDPYIVVSWKLPNLKNSTIPYEIRSEVLWNGNIALQYPNDLQGTQPYRITATTSFTIKGWMFKNFNNVISKIYTINSEFLTIGSDGSVETPPIQPVQPSLLQDFDTFVSTLNSNQININSNITQAPIDININT
jgi:hypothetical protein